MLKNNKNLIYLLLLLNILLFHSLNSADIEPPPYSAISIVIDKAMDFESMSINAFMGLPATSTAEITVHYDSSGIIIVDCTRSMSISNKTTSINLSLDAPKLISELAPGIAKYSIKGTMVNSVEPSSGSYKGNFDITVNYK